MMDRTGIRLIVIILIILFCVGGLIFSVVMLVREVKESTVQELQERIEVLEEKLANESESGGSEKPYVRRQASFEEGYEFLFPIEEEDFKYYTSPFGVRVSPLLDVEMVHTGVDIAGVWRSRVVAVADGVVVEHWPPPDGYYKGHRTYGGYVRIDHGEVVSGYAHLSWTRVHEGYRVKAGEVIGRIGDTGKSDGQHLHFELSMDGELVNPLLYIPDPLTD